MKHKTALITGITGQDGSYLAELLLAKGYRVYGLQRRASTPNTERIDHLYDTSSFPHFVTVYGDLTDSLSIHQVLAKIKPDEIYNLGAQSHVKVSFALPEYTYNVISLGTLRILEAIVQQRLRCKYYQASSSEMFGAVTGQRLQNEQTPFNPQSPYGAAKVSAYFTTRMYRECYDLFAANGILFNHESPRRGITFVTRKITLGLSRIKLGLQSSLKLGNLYAKRDWGYAGDYVEGIWKILQHKVADDFVLATGQTHTVKEFVTEAARQLDLKLQWKGSGKEEIAVIAETNKKIVEIDPGYFRPSEVDYLQGDASKAQRILGWQPKVSFSKLVSIMVEEDYNRVKREVPLARKVDVKHI
jgi:GDPmannose 4,6-dehydratase